MRTDLPLSTTLTKANVIKAQTGRLRLQRFFGQNAFVVAENPDSWLSPSEVTDGESGYRKLNRRCRKIFAMKLARVFAHAPTVLLLLLPVLLSGCYKDPGSGTSTTTASTATAPSVAVTTPGYVYPAGMITDAASLAKIRNVYPAVSGEGSCCWIGPNAVFRVSATPAARSMRLLIYVPAIGPLRATPPTLSAIGPNGKAMASMRLRLGEQTVRLPLAIGSFAGGSTEIHLHSNESFIPKDFNLNGDTRRLTVILESVGVN